MFPKLLSHKERHGVTLGNAYRNRTSRTEFTDYISKSLGHDKKNKIQNSNFYNLLTDGSTDSCDWKRSLLCHDIQPLLNRKQKVSSQNKLSWPVDPEAANAAGILKLIGTSFKEYSIGFYKELVWCGSVDQPLLTFGWCVAFWLELAL